MKKKLINFLKENLSYDIDFDSLIEVPKKKELGDFSMPAFVLSKIEKKSPVMISKEVAEKLNDKKPIFIEKIISEGPYINFYLNNQLIIKNIVEDIENINFSPKNKKILIEYPSPNTNKSLHVGHARNIFIGNSLSKILKKAGFEVIRTNLNNDRGIAVCKTMLSYKLFGENKTPESLGLKPDIFVSDLYVKYGKIKKESPELNLDEKAQDLLIKWERGDEETIELWRKILNWVFEGYKITYENYKVEEFDKEYFESEIYDKGKEIVINALKNKIAGFKEDNGAIYVDLEDLNLGKKYLLRGDGTTLYMTQDIYLANLKEKEFNADKYIFVVGEEQKYHFEVLFEILRRLGFGGVEKNYHLSYGYVYNEFGKKFSSRLGNTISADEILEKAVSRAKENLLKKELTKNLSEDELERRSKIIGYSAICFAFLKKNTDSSINFSLDRAISFEGETGPYCLYTYARIKSILRKNKSEIKKMINIEKLSEDEINLIKELSKFKKIVEEVSNNYKISYLSNYTLKISQLFNEFYQKNRILNEKDNDILNNRLYLLLLVSNTIKDSLELLNIEVLDEM